MKLLRMILTLSKKSQKFSAPRGHLDPALQHASHLRKPQLSFKRKPDNDNNTSWYPGLTHKYHAQVPLGFNYHDSDLSGPSDSTVTLYVIPTSLLYLLTLRPSIDLPIHTAMRSSIYPTRRVCLRPHRLPQPNPPHSPQHLSRGYPLPLRYKICSQNSSKPQKLQ